MCGKSYVKWSATEFKEKIWQGRQREKEGKSTYDAKTDISFRDGRGMYHKNLRRRGPLVGIWIAIPPEVTDVRAVNLN